MRRAAPNLVAPLEIDDIAGVIGLDVNLVFASEAVTIVEVRPAELLAGFFLLHNVVDDTLKIAAASATANEGGGVFAEIVMAEGNGPPEFRFSLVTLNGDEIPVEFEPRFVPPILTRVAEAAAPPRMARLAQNAPNPFNVATTLSFTLEGSTWVRLVVYNAAGQLVRTLVDGERRAGRHRAVWDGLDENGKPVGSGPYVARMVGEGFEEEIGMVLLK